MNFERGYGIARFVLSLEGIIGFFMILGGLVFAIFAGVSTNSAAQYLGSYAGLAVLSSALPGLIIALSGLILVGQAQWATAILDNADLTRELVILARKQSAVPSAVGRADPRF